MNTLNGMASVEQGIHFGGACEGGRGLLGGGR